MGSLRAALGVGLVVFSLAVRAQATAGDKRPTGQVGARRIAGLVAEKARQGGRKAYLEFTGKPPGSPRRIGIRERFRIFIHGDPQQLDKATLDALADRRIGSYFPEGLREAGLTGLDKDLRLYVYNLGKLTTGRPGALSDEEGLLTEWGDVHAALIKSASEGVELSPTTREKTVEQYVLALHRRVKNPQTLDPLGVRLLRGAEDLAWAPVRISGRIWRGGKSFVKGALVLSFGLGLFGGIVNAPLNRITTPIVTTFDNLSYVLLGDVQIKVQKLMSNLTAKIEMMQARLPANEQAETANEMQKVLKDFTRIADKYAIGKLTPAEARELWTEAETPLLLLGKNANAIANPIFKEGRNVHRDMVQNHFWFATYGAVEYNGMRDRQRDLGELEDKWEGREMPPKVAAAKQRLQEEIGAAQERLGMALAQWRINQILYPEYTKSLTIGNPRDAALLRTYQQMMGSMRLDIYFREAIGHYQKQLDLLGIPAKAQQMEYVSPPVQRVP